ncbi:hypothetical protein ISS40_01175 [Candidatus Bathyarchaeota archaeon]|nr:hypothetical protein [Bacteroidota bacterium]MBL7167260.1 hypothetical protein [Candidatus Bathyarchaeota archaeon]
MKLDTDETVLEEVIKEYELAIMNHLFSVKKPTGSGIVWTWINEGSKWGQEPGNSISRASVIMFLNRLVDEDLLTWEDATGKGGHHRLYVMELSRPEFAKKVIDKFLNTLKTIKDQEKM